MAQHISVRVPWHDDGWKGTVCLDPSANMSCLRLKNIYENRKDNIECGLCGKCMAEHEEDLPCISEGGAFMSEQELYKTTVHPYKKSNPKTVCMANGKQYCSFGGNIWDKLSPCIGTGIGF